MSMKSLQGRRIHPVYAMNAEQRQTAADPWSKPTDLSHWPAFIGNYETTVTLCTVTLRVSVGS